MSCFSCKVTKEMYYGRLFEKQQEYLLKRGLHTEAKCGTEAFVNQLAGLATLLGHVEDSKLAEVPFLIVVPNAIVPVSLQMALALPPDKQGSSDLEDADFTNLYVGTDTDRLYLAVRVHPAESFAGTAFDVSRKVIEGGTYGLTVEEGLALIRFDYKVLFIGTLDFLGSRHGQAQKVPSAAWIHDGAKLMAADQSAKHDPRHMFPTCVGRLHLALPKAS